MGRGSNMIITIFSEKKFCNKVVEKKSLPTWRDELLNAFRGKPMLTGAMISMVAILTLASVQSSEVGLGHRRLAAARAGSLSLCEELRRLPKKCKFLGVTSIAGMSTWFGVSLHKSIEHRKVEALNLEGEGSPPPLDVFWKVGPWISGLFLLVVLVCIPFGFYMMTCTWCDRRR